MSFLHRARRTRPGGESPWFSSRRRGAPPRKARTAPAILADRTQTPPDVSADDEADQRRAPGSGISSSRRARWSRHDGRDVHSHEADERAKVEQLRAELIGQRKCAGQGQSPRTGRYSAGFGSGSITPKKPLGMDCPGPCRRAAGPRPGASRPSDSRHQSAQIHDLEERGPPAAPR